jgi:hypothetical protein
VVRLLSVEFHTGDFDAVTAINSYNRSQNAGIVFRPEKGANIY